MGESTDEFMSHDEDLLPDEAAPSVREANPEEIRAEIRETRERMGDTLEQLGERLNPGNLKQQVKQDIRDATIGKVEQMAQSAADQMGEARHTITDTIRENPVPAAMIGVGLGWLMYNARQQRGSQYTHREGRAWSGRYGGGYAERGYRTGYVGGMGAERRGSSEPGVIDRASDVASDVRGTAGEMTERTRQGARIVAGRAHEVAEDVAEGTRYQARRLEHEFYENPLAVGAAALALGVTAGLAIPETRKESQVMGGARDRLADKMREVAEETKDKVERVVDETQSTAKAAARKEGLTPS